MGNTIYASFADPSLAEKAAGALLDHGVRPEDLSVVRNHNGEATTMTAYGSTGTYTDGDNDAKNAADAGLGATKSVGNHMAEYGDRAAGAVAGAVGADRAAANYNASAANRDAIADGHEAAARVQMDDALDRNVAPGSTYGVSGTAATSGMNDPSVAGTTGVATTNAAYGDTAYRAGTTEDREDASDTEDAAKHGISTTTAGDAGAGAIKGTAWGAGVGVVAALASLLVPGVGWVLGGGALAAAIGGVAASAGAGAAAGAVTGYLKDQGVDDQAAEHYSGTVAGGGAILAVTLPSGNVDESEAHEVLSKYGAANVNSYAARGNSGTYVA